MNSQASSFCGAIVLLHYASQRGGFPRSMAFCRRGSTKVRRNPPKGAAVKDFLRLLFLLSLVLVVTVSGQTTNGNIQGTVVDAQDATVSGATVSGRNMDTGLTVVA